MGAASPGFGGGMEFERDESGRRVVTLAPAGWTRFVSAGFLCFWLVGWAAGELFALTMLFSIVGMVFFPETLAAWWPRLKVPTGAGTVWTLGFLGFWLAAWTFGGVMAMLAVGRALRGRDRIAFDGSGIWFTAGVGPFQRARSLERQAIRRIALRRRGGVLVAETGEGTVLLTGMGSLQDRERLRDELKQALGLEGPEGAALAPPDEPPPGWKAARRDDGAESLATDLRARVPGAVAAWLVAAALLATLVAIGGGLASQDAPDAAAVVGAGVVSFMLLGALAGAGWLTFVRDEWLVRRGALEHRRCLAGRVWTRRFDSPVLEIERNVDGEGDEFFHLVVQGAAGRRRIASALRDPVVPRDLGLWIAARTGADLKLPAELKAA